MGHYQPPLKYVPVDYQSTAQRSITLALFGRSDVIDNGSGRHLIAQLTDGDPLESETYLGQKLVDREMH